MGERSTGGLEFPPVCDGLGTGDRSSRWLGVGDESGGSGPLRDRASIADTVCSCQLLGKEKVD